jgi:4-amino-4-deoxy-L-arabinose transferase-like glycosyltransferase
MRVNHEKTALVCILFLASLFRLFYIGNIPGNTALYVDEMFSGYEAWSILKYGFDIDGYHLPVYLTAWGSGMSAMQAYNQLPFIWLFGLNGFSLRLPPAILGCITVYAFFYICKSIRNTEFAIFSSFILAVMPWHIMQSRYALDCYYFVGFITITIALLIKGREDRRILVLGFVFAGLTLYTYALNWMVMPIFVIGAAAFMIRKGYARFDKYMVVSAILLFLLAIPLILFVAVNIGFIHEIRTPFLSIPHLRVFRSDEVALSPRMYVHNLYKALNYLINQDDGSLMGCTKTFGLYYKFSNAFIAIGISECVVNFVMRRNIKRDNEFYILLLFGCAVILAGCIDLYTSFYRLNIIQIPMTYFLINGLWVLIERIKDSSKYLAIFIYSVSCFFFLIYYFTDYDDLVAAQLMDGSESAITYVEELANSGKLPDDYRVNVVSGVSFVSVLFYEEYPTDRFMEEVQYVGLDGPRVLAKEFGHYYFYYDDESVAACKTGDIYICSHDDSDTIEYCERNDMDITYLSNIVVAVAN